MKTIELGNKVKDNVTGLEGIAVSKCIFLNGCVQYAIQAKIDKDGKKPEEVWIDDQQLEIIGDGVNVSDSIPIPRKVISIRRTGGGFRNHPGG